MDPSSPTPLASPGRKKVFKDVRRRLNVGRHRDVLASYLRALRWRGTVLPSVYLLVAINAVWAGVVAILVLHVKLTWLAFDEKLISLMNFSIALLLGFRVNRAFDRYWAGSQLWTQLASNIKNACRIIWNSYRHDSLPLLSEKIQHIKLLLAVAVATKHNLRGGNPFDYEDIIALIPSSFYTKSTTRLQAEATGVESPTTERKFLQSMEDMRISSRMSAVSPAAGNVGLEIVSVVGSFVRRMRKEGVIDHDDSSLLGSTINSLSETLTKLEQILFIPMPKAFDTLMKQILIVYFIALPLQLVRSLGYWVIPVVAVTSFAIFGVETIIAEISEPFGFDENDLPLENFCEKLRQEIEYITDRKIVPDSSPSFDRVDSQDINGAAESDNVEEKKDR